MCVWRGEAAARSYEARAACASFPHLFPPPFFFLNTPQYGEQPGLAAAQQATRERSHEEASEIAQKAADTRTGKNE